MFLVSKDNRNSISQPLEETTVTQAPQTDEPKQMGRPKIGKRSKSDYTQVTAYVKKETYDKVKDEIGDLFKKERKKLEFSDLVQELLEGWLKARR